MAALPQSLLASLGAIVGAMLLLWLVSLKTRDVSLVNLFWGVGFVIVVWLSLTLNCPATDRVWLLAGLTTIWGLRLAIHLAVRKRRRGEDPRYASMREHHGVRFWWVSLFTVFLLQAAILWFVSLPLQAAAAIGSKAPLGWLDALGASVWAVGLFFEAVGDWQLTKFQADPTNRDRVMDRGLWRSTRHPNYFGDACVWWGLYAIAAAGDAWWTVLSPLLMLTLLLKFSGVKLTEKNIGDRRPEYARYKERTNAFVPRLPKRN